MNKVNFLSNAALTLIQKKAQTPTISHSGFALPLHTMNESAPCANFIVCRIAL